MNLRQAGCIAGWDLLQLDQTCPTVRQAQVWKESIIKQAINWWSRMNLKAFISGEIYIFVGKKPQAAKETEINQESLCMTTTIYLCFMRALFCRECSSFQRAESNRKAWYLIPRRAMLYLKHTPDPILLTPKPLNIRLQTHQG